MPTPLALVADHNALIGSIRATLGAESPAAVVIDSLNRSLAGSESDDRDMALYIQAADAIRDAFNCAVVIVHHCGIDATRPRGHTSLTGAADAKLAVKRDEKDNIVATVEWMKDGPASDATISRLEAIEVVGRQGSRMGNNVSDLLDQARAVWLRRQLHDRCRACCHYRR